MTTFYKKVIFFPFTKLSIIMQKTKMRSICWTVKHTTLPKYPFCYFTHPSSLKGVGKPHLKLTQFNNSLKENEGQSIVQEIVKRYKLFKTCYYKITQRSCKYSPSKSFSCHLWFKRCILSWPFNRISVHFCLLLLNCQAVSQIRTSIPC